MTIVTGKPSKNFIVITAITLLYLPNVIGGCMEWVVINVLFGTNGQLMPEDLAAEMNEGTKYALYDIALYIPYIVSDGLLVRYSCLTLKFH